MVCESPLGEHRLLAKRKAPLRDSQVGVEDNWKKAKIGIGGVKPRRISRGARPERPSKRPFLLDTQLPFFYS